MGLIDKPVEEGKTVEEGKIVEEDSLAEEVADKLVVVALDDTQLEEDNQRVEGSQVGK